VRFLSDPAVGAIMPPWGGELAIELLDLIDFAALSFMLPKWLLGYSDLSTLQLPLTLVSGWATAHGPNLMDLAPTQTDPLTTSTLRVLSANFSTPVEQHASVNGATARVAFEAGRGRVTEVRGG
jgi:muramoyltetrapeptide carboxypeptidase LdcA involved in peptidoglycan recycling